MSKISGKPFPYGTIQVSENTPRIGRDLLDICGQKKYSGVIATPIAKAFVVPLPCMSHPSGRQLLFALFENAARKTGGRKHPTTGKEHSLEPARRIL